MESKENSLLRPARRGRCGEFFVFWFLGVGRGGVGWCGAGRCSFRAGVGAVLGSAVLVRAGAVFGPVSAGADRCWAVSVWVRAGVGVGRCSFRAGVGAVFILNGMIFSFLDEKRVFKGVV